MLEPSTITDTIQQYIPYSDFITKHYTRVRNCYKLINIDHQTLFIKINNQIGGSNIKTFSAIYHNYNYNGIL
jgi:hypothetical protein